MADRRLLQRRQSDGDHFEWITAGLMSAGTALYAMAPRQM